MNEMQDAEAAPRLTDAGRTAVAGLARRHGFSEAAVANLLEAVLRGGGAMAQFDHPAFGGSGQWMRGGMLMLGRMGDHALKARVQALCEDLAVLAEEADAVAPERTMGQWQQQGTAGGRAPAGAAASLYVRGPSSGGRDWWPDGLSSPASTGSQNGMRYAWFPRERRLAVDLGGQVTVYDTGDHKLGGFSQQQAGDASWTFTSQHGVVRVAELPVVSPPASAAPRAPDRAREEQKLQETKPAAPAAATPVAHAPPTGPDVLHLIERLADLKAKGVLTDEEFLAKKSELLGRL